MTLLMGKMKWSKIKFPVKVDDEDFEVIRDALLVACMTYRQFTLTNESP